jgi:transposase
MPKKHSVVNLTDEERHQISELTRKGTIAARKLARAHILRLADEGKSDADIVEALGIGLSTVERTRKKYVEVGLDQALTERPRPGVKPKLDEKGEAYLIALSCSTPPDEQVKWTMQLLADRLVEVGIVDEISDETVRRTLKKTSSSPGKSSNGAFRA